MTEIVNEQLVAERHTWSPDDLLVLPDGERPLPTEIDEDAELTAAGEPHTGAMIALIPSEVDATRLAVDGGEPAEELHVTLAYLGEAALLPVELQHALVDCVARCTDGMPTIIGDAFAVSMFNPPDLTAGGRESCIVLGLSGDQLERAHENIMRDVVATFAALGVELQPQHSPWVPHMTLVYTDDADLTYFTDRTGPVTFDRVRLAFGGEIYDVPLGDYAADDIVEHEEPVEVSEMTAAGTEWMVAFSTDGELLVPNVLIDLDSLQERDVSIPGGPGHTLREYWVRGKGAAKIRWGTDGSFNRCVRQLSKYVTRPQGLCAEYHKAATGEWPAEKGVPSDGDAISFDAATVIAATEHRFEDGICFACKPESHSE